MMKGFRRVAVVEEFWSILVQIHCTDRVHAGVKKTYARVSYLLPTYLQFRFVLNAIIV